MTYIPKNTNLKSIQPKVTGLRPVITGVNLIADPGFEKGITGYTGITATLSQDGSVFRGGAKSLKAVVSASTGGVSYTLPSQTSGKRIFFDVYVKGDATSAGKFVRGKITTNGDAATQDTVKYKLSSTVWTRIRCSKYIATTGTVTLTIQGVDLANTNIFYLDDIYVDFVSTPVIRTQNRRFYYNNTNVFLRCANYNNKPTGHANDAISFAEEEAQLPYDFADLRTQGVNSIRVYYDVYNANKYGRGLDCAWNFDIMVMLLNYIWLPGTDYTVATGGTNRSAHVTAMQTMVNSVKTHPAIISYGDGSEANYNLGGNSLNDWFTLLELVCAAFKATDNTRITYTANGGLPIPGFDATYPSLDLFGATMYGGNSGAIYRGSDLTLTKAQIRDNTSKALMSAEIGTGCYDGSANGLQAIQGESDVFLIEKIESFYPYFTGHAYFQFMDDRNSTNGTDNSWYGKAESLAAGAAQSRTKRTSFGMIQDYFTTHPIPGS
jgi:hypothetical protein